MEKKLFFWALPQSPKPPPPLTLIGAFFSEVKIKDLKVSLELKILYILYNILYILELKSRKGGKRRKKAEKGGKGGFGCAISLLAKVVSKRTTGHRVPD